MTFGEFADGWFGRRTLVVKRNRPDHFAHLVTTAALDDFLASTWPGPSRVFAVDSRRELATADYAGPDGQVDPVRLLQLFDEGATVSFRQMQDELPTLAALCRAGERLFTCPFQTNLYFTPPGAQGFKVHHDTHDVFVLQVEGSKRWRVHDPVIALPLVGQEFAGHEDELGPVTEEFILCAGDMFYCPRGVPHEAETTGEPSLHITLGALVRTWAEVMIETMAGLCLSDADFREALPPGWATGKADPDGMAATFGALARRFAERADPASAIAGMAEQFITGRRPQAAGQRAALSALAELGPDTEAGVRRDLVWRLDPVDDALRLVSPSAEILFPTHVEEALRFALGTSRYRIGDLPGDLDGESRLVLVRRLVREGMVTLFPGDP